MPDPAAKPRLLLADDDALIRAALTLQLAKAFDVVGEGVDADEAIAKVAELDPDIVILDVEMPGGGGLRATTEIRAANPTITIVALSADESDQMVRAMVQAGAIAYVRKGMDGDELIAVLRDCIAANAG